MRVSTYAALSFAALAFAAGCGDDGTAEELWEGPPPPAADGSVSVDGFVEYQGGVDAHWEGSAEMTAAEFLRLDERTAAATTVAGSSEGEGSGPRTVVVTLDGLFDDSVRAERWTLALEPVGETFELVAAVRELRCHAGRGHTGFCTRRPCTCADSGASQAKEPLARHRAQRFAVRQRPKMRPPTVNPRPNVPSANAPIGDELAPKREAAPAADRLLFLGRERLPAPLLANGAARPQAEIDVVEELRRLVRHGSSLAACMTPLQPRPRAL